MKEKPEKFQECPDVFDLIITVEERIYDSVVEGKRVFAYYAFNY